MTTNNLENLNTHFEFGNNWLEYSKKIGKKEIEMAIEGIKSLFPGIDLKGKEFLDVGCGSGVHSLAALMLGANVTSLDIDPVSVKTTKEVLRSRGYCSDKVFECSVFEMDKKIADKKFDIVYSWGVLHHTGDMWKAIDLCADRVASSGYLSLALYKKTALCKAWEIEKKWYTSTSKTSQKMAQKIYIALFWLAHVLTGKSFKKRVQNYASFRGMDFYHDVHDWMGGYPYESISNEEIKAFLEQKNFFEKVSKCKTMKLGIFGSGCSEWTYQKSENSLKIV